MAGHECYHCKQWIEEGAEHDCWTTTETALTQELAEDLRDAYDRIRETAVEFGEQRIYASHHSIMFSRKSCYFFIRPRRQWLEMWIFLGRAVKAPQVQRVERSSPTSRKACHLIKIRHRDEVEAPITDWMREAYQLQDMATDGKARKARKGGKGGKGSAPRSSKKKRSASSKKGSRRTRKS